MRDPLEFLTLLNPSRAGTEYYDTPSGQAVTGHEVRAALNGLEDGPLALADWLGTDNEISRQQCRDCLAMDLRIVAMAKNWKRKNDEAFMKRMSSAAIEESLGKKRLCADCNGTGIGLAAICKACGGKGRIWVTVAVLAKKLGVPSGGNWYTYWAPKYMEARFLLYEYKKQVRNKLWLAFCNKKQTDKVI